MQSATLGRNLSALENHLGMPLFVRQGRDTYLLTSDGHLFSHTLEPVMKALKTLEPKNWEFTEKRVLKVGLAGAWAERLIPAFLQEMSLTFSQLYPYIQQCQSSDELEQRLLQKDFLVGLSFRPPVSEALCYAAGPASPYGIVSTPSAQKHWSDFVYVKHRAEMEAGLIDGPWDEDAYPRIVLMETDNLMPMLTFCSTGQAAAWLPLCLLRPYLESQQLAVVAEPPEPRTFTPYIWWSQDMQEHPCVTQAIPLLKRQFESEFSP